MHTWYLLPMCDMTAARVLLEKNIHHEYNFQFGVNYPEAGSKTTPITSEYSIPFNTPHVAIERIHAFNCIAVTIQLNQMPVFEQLHHGPRSEFRHSRLCVHNAELSLQLISSLVRAFHDPHDHKPVSVEQRRVSWVTKSKQILLQPLHARLHRV